MPKKSSKKIADGLWSEIIRWHGRCEWCKESGKRYEAAHIYSRRFLKTRWDLDNGLCLCNACHRKAHDKPLDFAKFVEGYIGGDIVETLRGKANRIDYKVNIAEITQNLRNHLSMLKNGIVESSERDF